jgi:uncharacterized membrane protein HdeD (DUF308 family)
MNIDIAGYSSAERHRSEEAVMADMSTPTRARTRPHSSAARVCTIIAFVFAALAVIFFPPVFGVAALVLGIVGGALGDRPLGWYAAAAGVLGGVIGIVLAAVVMNNT